MDSKGQLIFGLVLVLVMVAGVLLIHYSGSPEMKDAVEQNKLCQHLKKLGRSDYADCQAVLDTLVEQMLASNKLDINECEADRSYLHCPVRVWYIIRHINITSPVIAQRLNLRLDHNDRYKRAVISEKNTKKGFKNKQMQPLVPGQIAEQNAKCWDSWTHCRCCCKDDKD